MDMPIKYFPVNDQDAKWGLIVTTVGIENIAPGAAYPSKLHPSEYWFHPDVGRKLNEFQLVYITRGSGMFKQKNKPAVSLTAGQIIFLFPGEWHTYAPGKNGWCTYWVGFKGTFAEQLLKNEFISKSAPVHQIGFQEKIISLIKDINGYAQTELPGYQPVIASATIHLLGYIHYLLQNNNLSAEIVDKVAQAKLIMQEHAGGELPAEEVAKTLNISYSWFRKVFKKHTGLSPSQYQHQLKMQKAREWLANSNKTVKEIAYILNFESPNYFNSSFKQAMGITPVAFRKLWRLNS